MTDQDEAAQVRQIWAALGLPGVIDVHTHFMADSPHLHPQSTYQINSYRQMAPDFWHGLDDMTQYRGTLPQDSFFLKGDYGSMDFDTRHTFTATLSWPLPPSTRSS